LDQEIGVTGLTLEHMARVEYRADVGNDLIEHELVDIYLARVPNLIETKLNPEEVCDVKWVALADLQSDIAANPDAYTPWLKIYLNQHLETILGAIT
jgi:isopentenyl-diphosphate delta-isomerase